MKKVLAIVLCLAMAFSCVGILAACHKHTYDESKWESDATYHWHAATCEHTEEVSDKAEHDFGTDNKCKVCGYEKKGVTPGGHEHTFAKGWTSDETHHWHVATCEHTTLVDGKAAHDFDSFNKCKVCDYQGEITFSGDTIDAEAWTDAFEALSDISNFTIIREDKDGSSYAKQMIQVMQNAMHQYATDGSDVSDSYMVIDGDTATLYYKEGGIWFADSSEATENLFEEQVAWILHEYVSDMAQGLATLFDSFEYSDAKKAYVLEAEDNGEKYFYEVKFVGSSIYSVIAGNTDEDGNGTIYTLDAIGNTSFEIEALHKHDFSTVWSSNNVYHWHDAICHEGEFDEKVPHTWGTDNKCTECGHTKAATTNSTVDKETFASALQLKGLTNWTAVLYEDGEVDTLIKRSGNVIEMTMYGENMFYELDGDKLWYFIEVEEGVWEKLDYSDELDPAMFEAEMNYLLSTLSDLAELWDELELVNDAYTAEGLEIFIRSLFYIDYENATVSFKFDDGEVIAISIADMDGEDVAGEFTFGEIGTTTITLPDAKIHQHEWEVDEDSITDDEHRLICTACYSRMYEKHQWAADGKTCTVCEYEKHDHVWVVEYVYEDWHEAHCSVCGMSANGKHTFGQDAACTVCGVKSHPHDFGWTPDPKDVDRHLYKCKDCTLVQESGTHQFEDWGEDVHCTLCGADYHAHDYQFVADTCEIGFNQHQVYCADCGKYDWWSCEFDEEKAGETCNVCGAEYHVHDWQYNDSCWTGINQHGVYCPICDEWSSQDHVFDNDEDNDCNVCGAPRHNHNWQFVEGPCSSNEGGHELWCQECGGWDWEEHNYGSGDVCEDCGYDRSDD